MNMRTSYVEVFPCVHSNAAVAKALVRDTVIDSESQRESRATIVNVSIM